MAAFGRQYPEHAEALGIAVEQEAPSSEPRSARMARLASRPWEQQSTKVGGLMKDPNGRDALTLATGIMDDLKIKFTDKLGGRPDTLGGIISQAVQEAHSRMVADAREAGVDGIVGLRVQFAEVGGNKSGTMIAAMAYGTVVKLAEDHLGEEAKALLGKLLRIAEGMK